MIPIKIQCGCGQRYAFDVEPVNGRIPAPVACPACGADGTAAANEIIAASRPVPKAIPVAVPVARASVAAAPPPAQTEIVAPRERILRPGEINELQAASEARSKILWGDPTDAVIMFLLGNGFKHGEAKALVNALVAERAAMVRKTGIRKIMVGTSMMVVPVIAWISFLILPFVPIQLLGLSIMVGVIGAWIFLNGAFKVLRPRSEGGDVADH